MQDDDARLAYLAKVASLYYEQHKTQQEIADELGLTRSAISRLVTEAHERGLVEISVRYPWTSTRLEQVLRETFNLQAARVLVSEERTYEEMLKSLGLIAARYLTSIMREQMVIGISWGTALHHMIDLMPAKKLPSAEVVQLIGATGSEGISIDGPMLAQLLANRLECSCRYLHAPLVVDSEVVCDALLQERTIRDTLARARQADVALVGIGSTAPSLNSLLRAGYVNEEDLKRLQAAGAVGDICARHYSTVGDCLDLEINRRVIGIDLAALSNIPIVIGVAGGEFKAEAILGALRGRYVNTLITDDRAAKGILALNPSVTS